MFYRVTGLTRNELAGKRVLDYGCGGGRFIEIARECGATVVGIDKSTVTEWVKQKYARDGGVSVVRGDITAPPLPENSFDIAYSIGVLHHTPDPEAAFRQMVRMVKPGGVVACCVYPETGGWGLYDSPAVRAYRKIYNLLPRRVGNRLALAYSYLSAYALYPLFNRVRRLPIVDHAVLRVNKYLVPVVYLVDPCWRVMDTFDAITPLYASTHTDDEVRGWYLRAGLKEVCNTRWCRTSFRGLR